MKAAIEVLSSKLGSLFRSQILSILLPGAVILLEVWLLAGYPQLPDPVTSSPIPYRNVIGVVLFLYLAYAVGFCARQLSFLVSESSPKKLAFWRNSHTEGGLPFNTRRWGERFYCREAFKHNWTLLSATFGDAWVEKVRNKHPFGLLEVGTSDSNAYSPEEVDFRELFHYCKYWLQGNHPSLTTVPMEVEFNLQLSVMVPLGLLPFVVLRVTGSLVAFGLASAVSIALTAVLVRRANHLRHAEVFNVLRNVLFAHWFYENAPPMLLSGNQQSAERGSDESGESDQMDDSAGPAGRRP